MPTSPLEQVQWDLFLRTFHEHFPAAIGAKRRREIFNVARELLAERVQPDEVLDTKIADAARHKKHLKKADYAIIAFIFFIALWVWAWTTTDRPELQSDHKTRTDFFDDLFERLEAAANKNDESQWPFLPPPPPVTLRFEPEKPSRRSPPRTQERSRSGTSGVAKPKPSKRAKPPRKKK